MPPKEGDRVPHNISYGRYWSSCISRTRSDIQEGCEELVEEFLEDMTNAMGEIYIPVNLPDQTVLISATNVNGNRQIILKDQVDGKVLKYVSFDATNEINKLAKYWLDQIKDISVLKDYIKEGGNRYLDDSYQVDKADVGGIIKNGRFLITRYVFKE